MNGVPLPSKYNDSVRYRRLVMDSAFTPEKEVLENHGFVERRRSGLGRSVYAGILTAVFGLALTVAVSVMPATDVAMASAAPTPANLNSAAALDLIEAPSVADDKLGSSASEQSDESHAHDHRSESSDSAPRDSRPLGSVAPGSDQTEVGQRGIAALESISYPWPEQLRGWVISFHPPKKGLYGLTLVQEKRIEIYLRDDEPQSLLAHVLAHEIGHAVDVTYNDGPARRIWTDAREIESSPWWPGDGATDFSTGAGDFAEAFAAWQVGPEHFRSRIAGPPTPEQIEILAALSE